MTADYSSHDQLLPLAIHRQMGEICDRFEADLKAGEEPSIERSLGDLGEPAHSALLRWLLLLELDYRRRRGETLKSEDYKARFPQQSAIITDVFGKRKEAVANTIEHRGGAVPRGLHIRCPDCRNPIEILVDAPLTDVTCTSCGSHFSLADEPKEAHPGIAQNGEARG